MFKPPWPYSYVKNPYLVDNRARSGSWQSARPVWGSQTPSPRPHYPHIVGCLMAHDYHLFFEFIFLFYFSAQFVDGDFRNILVSKCAVLVCKAADWIVKVNGSDNAFGKMLPD